MVSKKRIVREMTMALLAVGSILLWLNTHGISSRTNANTPRTVAVERLQYSLNTWKDQKVHGKILVLFDRHLPDAPLTHLDFELQREDISPTDARVLLNRIAAEFGVHPDRQAGSEVDQINQILRNPQFARKWQAKSTVTPPRNALRLIRITSGYMQPFDNMFFNEKRNIVLLNRLLLQASFPRIMPNTVLMPAKERTYVRSAIKAGIVRKIVHVISERSWDTVCKNLEELQTDRPSGAGFRIATFGGTPVYITRLRDLPAIPERTLVNIDSRYWTPEELAYIHELLRNGTLIADCLAISHNEPQNTEEE